MTAPNLPQQVAYDEDRAALSEFTGVARTRYTPPPPLGVGPAISATDAAELGALMGALGAEKGAVTSLLHDFQALAVKAHIEALPRLLEKINDLIKMRLNVVMQQVQAMQAVEVPVTAPGALARLSGVVGPTISYVSKDNVLKALLLAMERPAQT